MAEAGKSIKHVGRSSFAKQEDALGFTSDQECWKAFKQGNEAAFVNIYQQYFHVLFNYGCQFTTDQDLVQDCIQYLFIELRKNRQNLSDTTSIKKYLFVSLKRKIIYHLKRYKALDRRHLLAREFEVEFSVEDRLIHRQLSEQKIKRLQRAIKNLTARQREAIYYFYYENMSYKEVAEIMNLSHIKSVRNIVYKAIEALRAELTLTLAVLFTSLKL